MDFTSRLTTDTQSPNDQRPLEKAFYDNIIDFCEKNRHVTVKRIITVHHDTKIKKYKEIIDGAVSKELTNLHIAYFHLGNFSDTMLPYTTGAQVLLNDEVVIMHPKVARACRHIYPENPATLVHCKLIHGLFKSFWQDLWSKIAFCNDASKLGCILYYGGADIGDGMDVKQPIQKTWETIEKQINDVTVTIPADNPAVPSATEIWTAINNYRR